MSTQRIYEDVEAAIASRFEPVEHRYPKAVYVERPHSVQVELPRDLLEAMGLYSLHVERVGRFRLLRVKGDTYTAIPIDIPA